VLTRLAVCLATAAARLGELAWSRGNISSSDSAAEGAASRRTYPLMVALHAAVIAGTAALGGRRRVPALLLLLSVQPLRAWVLLTLGRRWNTRGAVSPATIVETGGPYRFVRHPNYAVVAVELAALPLAFGLWPLALAASAVNALLLALRIADEEVLLRQLPGWSEHFEPRKRFVPGLI
jgi:methyltransferase